MPRFLNTLRAAAIQITGGSPGEGKVLTSDASGNASWQEAAGGLDDGSVTVAKLNDDEIALYVKLNSEVFD